MSASFFVIASLTVAAAVAAMSLRNLIHCALALSLAFAGLAAAYLDLDAQFAGFAQLLVYVGAVAILIVFAILLTRSSEPDRQPILSPGWASGVAVAFAVLGVLVFALSRSSLLTPEMPPAPAATSAEIGRVLMSRYILPLEVAGLLLTAALIGAVLIAMREAVEPVKPDGPAGTVPANHPASATSSKSGGGQ